MIKRREDTEGVCDDSILVLREDQVGVLDAALNYIRQATNRLEENPPFGRIILPPRTGKTIIAASIAARDRRPMVFLAHTKILVEQAAAIFHDYLPTTPVWTIAGGSRNVGEQGIVVATYQSLNNMFQAGELPPLVRAAELVFADEAHHAMTKIRQETLRKAFKPGAIRIALTATPDYDEERILANHFPDLIHEMTIQEGVQLGLLAPVRATAVEVDAGASHVRILAGDYNQEDVGHVMSRTPLLKAIEEFRYAEGAADQPALICCSTRAQAMAVFEHLAEHRPRGTACPVPILGDMDDRMRQRFLSQYEEGVLDTLITVGVLTEGWNSPRCKLLVDASPSLSIVRASQKFTRVMTKDGNREARIIMLVPSGLTYLPIMPFDVFGPAIDEVLPEDQPEPDERAQKRTERPFSPRTSPWQRLRESGIRVSSIQIHTRVLLDLTVARISTIKSRRAVQQIIANSFCKLDLSLNSFRHFLVIPFRVGDVTIRGGQLLRFLGFSCNVSGYVRFMQRYYPKVTADRLLVTYGHDRRTSKERNESFKRRRLDIIRALGIKDESDLIPSRESYADKSWLSELESPRGLMLDLNLDCLWPIERQGEDLLAPDEFRPNPQILLTKMALVLTSMDIRILKWYYGLDDYEDELTLREIGRRYGISREAIRRHIDKALRELRMKIKSWYHDDEVRLSVNAIYFPEFKYPQLKTQWISTPINNKRRISLADPPWSDYLDLEEFLSREENKNLSLERHPNGMPLWLCWHDKKNNWKDFSGFFLRPLKAWRSEEGEQTNVLVESGRWQAIYSRPTE